MFNLKIKKLLFLLGRPRYFIIYLLHGVVPSIEHRHVLNRSLRTIVDVGANRGQFALAAHLFCDAKIISFEPLSEASSVFRRVFEGKERVTLFSCGVADVEDSRVINVSQKDDSSSFLEFGHNQASIFPETASSSPERVDVARLDNCLSSEDIIRPSMLKLDIQGYELIALKSAGSLLEEFDHIYCECSFIEFYVDQPLCFEIIDYLSSSGFFLKGVYNLMYSKSGEPLQGDFHFSKSQV